MKAAALYETNTPLVIEDVKVSPGPREGARAHRFVDFYLSGKLHLDDMISRRIKLEDVNEGLQALKTGEVARSVIVFD